MPLEDKSIVVTGGNTGIGKAIVLAAAAEGTNVVVDYVMHPEYTAEVIAAAGRAGGCAVGVEADASRTDDLRRLIQTAEFGGWTFWSATRVSNPHVAARDRRSRLRQGAGSKPQERVLRRPARGAAVRGATQWRADVTISSTHEDPSMPGNIAYCVSKGAPRCSPARQASNWEQPRDPVVDIAARER